MKHFKIITTILFISSLCWTSCVKEIIQMGVEPPTVKVTLPIEGDEFVGGQVITIKGDATASKLKSLTIKITDDKTGTVLFTNSPKVTDLKTFAYNVTWTAKVSDWTDATVTVITENSESQQATKSVKIKIWL